MSGIPESAQYALTALANSVREMCGFILEDWTVVVVANLAENPRKSFYMNPQAQKDFVFLNHERILGVFHTHPSGVCWPSPDDVDNWPSWGRYFIATTREVGEFEKGEDGVAKPVG